jgi:hypothetical protein
VCVCVQELLGNVGEERKDERQREGEKLRERNREKWREIERRRECNGIAARRNSGAGTTEEGLWCAGRAGFPFLGLGLEGSFSATRLFVCRSRTHAQQCVEEETARAMPPASPFSIYATGHTATSAGGSFHWGGGKYTSKKEGDVGKTEISCLRRLRKRLRNPRVDSALDVAGCCCCSWCGQKLPRHKKFSFSISPTLLLLLLLILAL